MCLGEWEKEEGDYVAYVRTAESEKEAAVRLFLLSVRSGLEGGGAHRRAKRARSLAVSFGKSVLSVAVCLVRARSRVVQPDPLNMCLWKTWL